MQHPEVLRNHVSPDVQDVLETLSAAVRLRAQEVRLTTYRPSSEVGISFKIIERSGRTQHVRYRDDTYLAGERMAAAIFGLLCAPAVDVAREGLNRELYATFHPEVRSSLGLEDASVVSRPIRDGNDEDGFIVVITLLYASSPPVRRVWLAESFI